MLQLPLLLEDVADGIFQLTDAPRFEVADRILAVDVNLGGIVFDDGCSVEVLAYFLANDGFDERSTSGVIEITEVAEHILKENVAIVGVVLSDVLTGLVVSNQVHERLRPLLRN